MLELLVAYLSVLTPAMVAASVVTAGAALVKRDIGWLWLVPLAQAACSAGAGLSLATAL